VTTPLGTYRIKSGGNAGQFVNQDGLRELTVSDLAPLQAETWHVVEVIAAGNVFRMKVDDREVSAFVDTQSRLKQGAIALRFGKGEGLIIRKIEIKELKSAAEPTFSDSASPSGPPKPISNSIGMKFVLIPPGEFLMGSPDSNTAAKPDEKPQHRVRITRPFFLGVTEVTQGQFKAVMGTNPSYFKMGDDHPVEEVSWMDALTFCRKLSERERLKPPGGPSGLLDVEGYRLPTEAEWEYACRAGNTTRFSFGDDPARLGEFAWYRENAAPTTHRVGLKSPNGFGLYDMHGNVRELCWDNYDGMFYGHSPDVDPLGPMQAPSRVNRGGCWDDFPDNMRAARRHPRPPTRGFSMGFRVARSQPSR
jgi:formylglycine-generating enzyme required for sulfatase activity